MVLKGGEQSSVQWVSYAKDGGLGAEFRVLRAGGEWGRKASIILAIVFLKH